MDEFQGWMDEPASLHRYQYANDNPVMHRDPSGKMTIGEIMQAVSFQMTFQASRASMAFSAGGAALGNFYQSIGRYAETIARQVLSMANGIGQLSNLPVGRSVIDIWGQYSGRLFALEVKYALPTNGAALARLVKQMQDALTWAQTSGGQVVVWSFREPTAG